MGHMMEALHRLQTIERQLAGIRLDRDAKARRVAQHKRQVERTEEKLRESQLVYQQRRIRLDALQLDMTAREESVDRHRQALNSAKTNKEYAAILTAMNTEKADNSKLEMEVLQLMEETQSIEKEAAKIEEEKTELLEGVAKVEKALAVFDKQTKAECDNLLTQRLESSEGVPPSTLNTFQRVAKRHDGEALAPVIKLHPKRDEYMCGGCNLKVTLEVVSQLTSRDDVQICKVCGRILYLEGVSHSTK